MEYTAELKVKTTDSENLIKLFEPEEKKFERSEFEIQKKDFGIIFIVTAKDPTAMRATLSTITQILTIYHKLKEQKKK
ncbi:hypothetical protein HOK51_09890 [Candidatus Woesearchaeota archaeon]|jgi:tRNA threonylcarbamoyladenosine modification (KEOPS) complex  Pcc1 subunit|nr:hypothetical protein [Candidatus Woesearchaeota archaeon]MBT6520134.1 hypothetical protein [Candidatus Woesearchaeota archaeon]MBT7366739.1 hypothetical protein [Candidatus Woesearchaeota archaeon]